jgi:Trypsin-like peptidase domain
MAETLHLNSQIDHLLYSTTRIEAALPDGRTSTGTGFFMAFMPDPDHPDRIFPALITNRHVVEGATGGRILLHEASLMRDGTRQPSGARVYSEVADFSSAWVMHPDQEVDLAGAPLGKMIRDLEVMGHPVFFMQIGENLIPSQDALLRLRVIEGVVMVGYPQGLADEAHGFPLFRHGYTASHPGVDFNDRSLGALDIALVNGSSGSPVITYNPSLDHSVGGPQVHQPVLLGVLFGGPQTTAEGAFEIDPLPTVDMPGIATRMFMNIGYYVKARELLPLREAMLKALGVPGRQPDHN